MRTFADLHFHSKYSRAVSPKMELDGLNAGAKVKGLNILGTGDFTHPLWFKELKTRLKDQGNGFFKLDEQSVLFMLTCEVSTLISTPQGVRKVHHILHAPSLDVVEQLNERLAKKGNLMADGRPMFGKTSPAEIVELCREISKDIVVVPSHVWTPWFSVFGSKSGFDSIDEAYQDQARHIFALETGMSSTPAMNWRISGLDRFALMSNSDSHSPYPWRLGRECNAFEFEPEALTFDAFWKAVRDKDPRHFLFTVETPPAYGKYHWDGHRACKFSCPPKKTRELKGKCPVCKKPMTIGVQQRVESLADRPEGYMPKNAIPFKTLLPLHELLAAHLKAPLASPKVSTLADVLIQRAGNELSVLLDLTDEELKKVAGLPASEWILNNRSGQVKVDPGFDGEYGIVQSGPA
ncbi:MAG TPA: endonuclease Q family protein [Candidatus Norongarragalinales archaeon]|nr:endonuclease Q family protein [Candidatus Norongarragalinales archaeon]